MVRPNSSITLALRQKPLRIRIVSETEIISTGFRMDNDINNLNLSMTN